METNKINVKNNSAICVEQQWRISEKFLLETFVQEENNVQQYKYFIDSLDDIGLHTLEKCFRCTKNKK